MNKPICCNKPATPYQKIHKNNYGQIHSIEIGYRCKICQKVRIPFTENNYSDSILLDTIRSEGIKFDESLIKP